MYKVVYQCYDNNIKAKTARSRVSTGKKIFAHTHAYLHIYTHNYSLHLFSLHLSPTGPGERSPARGAWLVISPQWDWWSVVVVERCQRVHLGLPWEDGKMEAQYLQGVRIDGWQAVDER